MRHPLWIPWRWWRRAVQLAVLAAFLWLFRRTEYSGADDISPAAHFLFHLDPLATLAPMLAARQWIGPLWPALAVVGLTLLLGRFFCGWICPLGTLLDVFHWLFSPLAWITRRFIQRGVPDGRLLTAAGRSTRYVLLVVVLTAAVFAFPLVGFVDPFALLFRGMTFWADPALYHGVDAGFGSATEGWAATVVRPWVSEHLLPFSPMVFYLAGVSAAILAVIFVLELVVRRFWCRYVCPLGAMLGVLARPSLLKRLPTKACRSCGVCATDCRMGALDADAGLSPDACTLCMDCVDWCPKGIAGFAWRKRSKTPPRPVDLSRRSLLGGIVAGAAIPGVAWAAKLGYVRPANPSLLRPPGGDDERNFLNLCIRCGACMKVCPTNVLQPAVFESGVEGVFSPRLAPRFLFEQSFCQYDCTLCGQVCPTGAIPQLTEEAKHLHPMGKAYFDHSLCLPWAEKTPCIRCEEMCPVPDKAIKIVNTFTVKNENGEELEIQQPAVDRDLCVGCGMCESNCPVEPLAGPAGIRVRRVEAPDPGTEFLLKKAAGTR